MLKVGNLVINLAAIAYVDLEATKDRVKGEREIIRGIRIYFKGDAGKLPSLFFKGSEAEYLRKYFVSVASLCGSVE
ncbi:MAG: hypothetical protein KME52_18570 [Desmonostoc geniculatum HA4340-LM1]|jgi:hypothetical protein|nr:hypothetical protein [Desmonostoc geniculatum HA4340-LM1]